MLCVFYAFIKELVSHLFWENWELIAEVSARTFSQDGAIAAPPSSRRSWLAFRPAACLPGRHPWAGSSGLAAMSSGQAGSPGRRLFLRDRRLGRPVAMPSGQANFLWKAFGSGREEGLLYDMEDE